jgi:hypothetical protein
MTGAVQGSPPPDKKCVAPSDVVSKAGARIAFFLETS